MIPNQPPKIELRRETSGTIRLRSLLKLPPVRKSLAHLFDEVTSARPDAIFMRQRDGVGMWREVSYSQAQRWANGLAQWLIDQGIGFGDTVCYLAESSIEHGIAAIGVQRCGAAIAPISVNYSLASKDFARLRECVLVVRARVVIVDDAQRFAPALRAIASLGAVVVAISGASDTPSVVPWADVVETEPTADVHERMERITPATIARIMYTSGSTGSPKATPQSHANLTITIAQSKALGLLDFDGEGPQVLDAMPFSHIMAGNFTFGNVIAAGGTIWLDDGKPTQQLFARTIENLRSVSPHYFITVPVGCTMLCQAMEHDASLRDRFFSRLRFLGFGGAVLPEAIRQRLLRLSLAACGREIPIFSFYGATEYLFGALKYWSGGATDVIGLPPPGTELKLVECGGRYDLRVKGPTLMPMSGYIGALQATSQVFDEEGYFISGDAVRFADPGDPTKGLMFAGRLSEDFKLDSGTFVPVAELREALINTLTDQVQEILLCGINQRYVGALLWLSPKADRALIKKRIAAFNAAQPGLSRRIGAALVASEPLSFDAGEVTVKGNMASRVVRERRATTIAKLYTTPIAEEVMRF